MVAIRENESLPKDIKVDKLSLECGFPQTPEPSKALIAHPRKHANGPERMSLRVD